MATKQNDSRLAVVVTDMDTKEPLEGIPISFYQRGNPDLDHVAIKTDAEGQAIVKDLKMNDSAGNFGEVEYEVNFGGCFGYPQLSPSPFKASVWPGKTTIREHELGRLIAASTMTKIVTE